MNVELISETTNEVYSILQFLHEAFVKLLAFASLTQSQSIQTKQD